MIIKVTFSKEELWRLSIIQSRQKVDMGILIFERKMRQKVAAKLWPRYKLINTTDNMKAILGFLQSISSMKKRVKMETRRS
jgi:hypothetical protein